MEKGLACPICDVLNKSKKNGKYCSVILYPYNEKRPTEIQTLLNEPFVETPTIVLKKHTNKLEERAANEAMVFLRKQIGLIKFLDVPGHWGLQVMPGNWSNNGNGKMFE